MIREFGSPNVLNLEDVPQPTLGAGEIVIRVRAATVNQTLDVALRAGKYARRPPLPHVPGSDAAGEVTAVASDVKTIKAGRSRRLSSDCRPPADRRAQTARGRHLGDLRAIS